jgi:hypothetical protein
MPMRWAQLTARDRGRLALRAAMDERAYLNDLAHVNPSKAALRREAAAAVAAWHGAPVRWSRWAPVAGEPWCWERHTVSRP